MTWPGSDSEPKELRRCIRDLIALSALPAIWDTMLPAEIVESIAASLVSMLDAELVFVSVGGTSHGPAIQHGHTRLGSATGMLTGIRQSLESWLPGNAQRPLNPIPNALGGGKLYIASARIGFGSDAVIVVGSINAGFPNRWQRLLLDTAANETAIGLHLWNSEVGQHRFSALVERSSDFIGIADMDGRPTYLNPAGLHLVGIDSLNEVSELRVSDFVAEDDRDRFRNELWPLFLRQGRWSGELKFRHFRGGADIPVLVDWFAIDEPRTKKPLNIATVSVDLRLVKATEAELRSLNDTLERRVTERTTVLAEVNDRLRFEMAEREIANARLEGAHSKLFHASRLSATGHMAATLAHEMSQPLTATTNFVNAAIRLLANARPNSIGLAREAVTEAAQQVARASQIIKRIRDYADRGKPSRQMESVRTIVDEGLRLALIGADSLGVKVTTDFDPDASVVYVDRIQIQQVLVNLVRNALEAVPDGKGLELTIRASPVRSQMIEISVADRGPGLPRDVVKHLFEPFTTTKQKGMGLGLSICHSIVIAHGGLIRSEPNPGGGTIFAFTLEAKEGSK